MEKKILKSAGESATAAQLREAIGAGPDEEVEIVTPQFERTPDDPAPIARPDAATFARLHTMSAPELRELGLRQWNDHSDPDLADVERFGGGQLWLLPGEWYEAIPEGFELTSIMGERVPFRRGVTDNDIRFGCLAYGVLVPRAQVYRG